jgi:hypothetical protein
LAALRIEGIVCGADCPMAAVAPMAMAVGLVFFWIVLPVVVAAAAWLISEMAFNTRVQEVRRKLIYSGSNFTSASLKILWIFSI